MKEDNKLVGRLHVIIISSILGLCGVVTGFSYEANYTLFVADQPAIFMSSKNSDEFVQLPLSEMGRPYGIDVDIDAGIIFWVDAASYRIKRGSLDGADFEVVAFTGSGPRGITIDRSEREVYWVDAFPGSIEMVNYDGSGRRTVLSQSGKEPMDIVVHAAMRNLFWTTVALGHRAIMTSNCDGSDNRTLIAMNDRSYRAGGLALNADGSRLYWCYNHVYGYSQWLKSSAIDGSDQLHFSTSAGACSGMAWFEGDIYVADSSDNDVKVVNEQTHSLRSITRYGFSYPRDVFVGRLTTSEPVEEWKCDFEYSRCGCTQSITDEFAWTSRRGVAAVNSSGPSADHAKQHSGGRYMIAVTASPSLSGEQVATLVSPSLKASRTAPNCFRFWYHMNTTDSLRVFFRTHNGSVSPIPLWTEYGNQPDEWIGAEMEVNPSGVGNIIIQAITDDPASSSIAIDDVQFGKCIEASRLRCGDTSMTVYLNRARLGISTSDDVALESSDCKGYEYDQDTIAIATAYDECGTSLTESDDVIVFSNKITVLARSGIRNSDIEIRVNCSLTRSYQVQMTYLSHRWIQYIREAGLGNFSVGIRQYPNEQLHRPYPSSSYPIQVGEGETIYMATEMSVIKDTVESKNSRCWVTKSPDPMDSVQQDLIQDGCPVGGSVHLISSDNPSVQPFSFIAFSLGQEMGLIYVHCDVIVCHQSEVSACSTDCTNSRRRRGSHNVRGVSSGPHTVSQGPFISKPRVEKTLGTLGGRFDGRSALLMVAGTCIVLLSIAVVVFARNRK